MITDKQKEALKIVLELHKEGEMTNEQVLTIIETLAENTSTVQYVPWTTDTYPLVTYQAKTVPEILKYETTCK